MRDPKTDPAVGDVLQDRLGKIHVVAVNARPGVPNVSWDRQPTGMPRHDGYRQHCTLTRWREKMVDAEVCATEGE